MHKLYIPLMSKAETTVILSVLFVVVVLGAYFSIHTKEQNREWLKKVFAICSVIMIPMSLYLAFKAVSSLFSGN